MHTPITFLSRGCEGIQKVHSRIETRQTLRDKRLGFDICISQKNSGKTRLFWGESEWSSSTYSCLVVAAKM
jgi:hypothetical protein